MTDREQSSRGAANPAEAPQQPGFRLEQLEVFNWGTFHERVWRFNPRGENALLTGDIGSGKSTLVDAITTLLVPPQKLSYNKAAGAEARERTLRSYVLGHYKAERASTGSTAKPVGLRDHNSYSVILARFFNQALAQHVTLAQVFWLKDVEGPPARLFVVADRALSIAEDFAGFGAEIAGLRRRLKRMPKVEINESFPPYAAAFRRRLGIDNEQALELFHQTVSMKAIGNLTDFVRDHMLEAFAVEERIQALVSHFDDLNRAHAAVLKAKAQIESLRPLVADCEIYGERAARIELLRRCREALRGWFAGLKAELLAKRRHNLETQLERLAEKIDSLELLRREQRGERDEVKQEIAENGGARLENLKVTIAQKARERDDRRARAVQYDELAASAGLPPARNADTFLANREEIRRLRESAENTQAETQNALTEASVEFRQLRERHEDVEAELASLRDRRSNIPRQMLKIREQLCVATKLHERDLPFAGELLSVRDDEREWEGAAERLLHQFGLSLLVEDVNYARVAEWVDGTHLGARLVYYRVRERDARALPALSPASLVRKVAVKPDSPFYGWLETELSQRFNYECCDTLDAFRRADRAVTRAGQTKSRGTQHEKDDRRAIDDRTHFVLGWSNEAKIAAVQSEGLALQRRVQEAGSRVAELQARMASQQERLGILAKLHVFQPFRDLDWRPLVSDIERLDEERRKLESESNVLQVLERKLSELDTAIAATEETLVAERKEQSAASIKHEQAGVMLEECAALVAGVPEPVRVEIFPRLEAMRPEALGEHTLTIESCDNRQQEMRGFLQDKIDTEERSQKRLSEKILTTMADYRNKYPLDTQEVDASLAAAREFAEMLERLVSDDLPRFEARFKQLLNENTIREVANFQSQLARERETIRERVEVINGSLREIDYNPGRYIRLEAVATADAEVRDFQLDLRSCTEGALTGSLDEEYSETKFLQVKRIIERFRGREGTTELDKRWTRKVTDVRNWFEFAASERWREGDEEHEHYTDSGGKSGGQKEKLAYTVLAASLAYQFGLEWGASKSRSFRFVVIDEAFGRGSDESARYGLELFERMSLQLLIVTPLQKIHIIEPHVASVGFVHNEDGRCSMLRNLTIEEYRAEKVARSA